MSDENIVTKEEIIEYICNGKLNDAPKQICDRIKKLNDAVLDALHLYLYTDTYEVKLTKKELDDLIKKCEFLNSLNVKDTKETRAEFLSHMLGDIEIQPDGNKVIHNIEMLGIPSLKNSKTDQLLTKDDLEALTPLKLKEWLKDRKWTYKDLAEAIGASEGTIKNWIIKGEIPEWAKRSVLYIQKCEEFEKKLFDCIEEHTTIKESLRDFKDLLDNI